MKATLRYVRRMRSFSLAQLDGSFRASYSGKNFDILQFLEVLRVTPKLQTHNRRTSYE